MITPNTSIRLLKVPFEIDRKNQLTFTNLTAQTNYFLSLTALEKDNTTYQRQNNIIRFEAPIDTILTYNYVMYKNESYSNKWFYAYITKMEYKNDNTTDITIQTDVFQTWQFDIIYKKMFVEREHVNNDTIGAHTVPENVELGEYVIDNLIKYNMGDPYYIIQCTEWVEGDPDTPLATNYGGIFAAGGAYLTNSITAVVNILQDFTQTDSVFGLYIVPSNFVRNDLGATASTPYVFGKFNQNSPVLNTQTIDKPSTLNSYTPVNKKLLTFPYCFLNVSNNNGSSNAYQYELFAEQTGALANKCVFNLRGVPTMGGSIKCSPIYYKNISADDEEEGIVAGKFPSLSWSKDEYTNWLTQNGVNIGLGVASSLIGIVGGVGLAATGGGALVGAGAVVSGGMQIANTMGQIYEHSLTPNSARGNTNSGDINTCAGNNTFYFYKMSIKQEYAKIIDDYFSAYGYKVNSYKLPNVTGRTNWNFVKTIDANLTGDIPQEDLQEIKDIFNNGVTFWHNPATFLDYSQSNAIVS